MPFPKPRFLVKEIENPAMLAKSLEAAFDGVYGSNVQTEMTVAEQGELIIDIQNDVTNITNIFNGNTAPSAIVESIDLTATGSTLIYTLPLDFAFIDCVWLVGRTVTGTGADPIVSLEIASGEDVALGQTVRGFTQTPTNQQVFRFPELGSSKRMAAGDSLSLTVDSAAGHTAFVVDLYLYLRKT